jgi:hypothetical protein
MREKRQFLQQCSKKATELGHVVKIFNDGIKVDNNMYFKACDLLNDEWLITCGAKTSSPPSVNLTAPHNNKRQYQNDNLNNPFKRLRSNSDTNLSQLDPNNIDIFPMLAPVSGPSNQNNNKPSNKNFKKNQGNSMPPPSRGHGKGGRKNSQQTQ